MSFTFSDTFVHQLGMLETEQLVEIVLKDGIVLVGHPDCVVPCETPDGKYDDAIVIDFPEGGGATIENYRILSYRILND